MTAWNSGFARDLPLFAVKSTFVAIFFAFRTLDANFYPTQVVTRAELWDGRQSEPLASTSTICTYQSRPKRLYYQGKRNRESWQLLGRHSGVLTLRLQ